ncbi:hypothetical protein A3D77_01420 [Candidatus Gottesmanbacteria bacterium RIFCSPHIGHO2_02_FULL_39_11]|uniref:Ribbon-helix-helix protein CopG domain-containing protein n=1 Tax=Candidatus Gottesmanbacteria bacterium RIFCSPHIGHO2_02_FULL_39_11 TaxID=1798382 RepID=A0A1F5ZT96_9BACT|nr:MAG: hypothetical protein A3D77_01420 [Candidatus Gottesmanbacteria bacterium RIFCSPHIGHO2_02_FULL_39_11]
MINPTVRTTVDLPEDLIFAIKQKALNEKKSLKYIIYQALTTYMKYKEPITSTTSVLSLFGAWGKGEKGIDFLKRVRYSPLEKEREEHLEKQWKKS